MSGIGSGKAARFSKILSINSNDRQPGQAGDRSSNFIINLGTNLQECSAISYKSCSFNNNFYNVRAAINGLNSTYNNKFGFTIVLNNGTPIPVVGNIPAGYYTATSLAQAMIGVITAYTLGALGINTVFSTSIDPASRLMTFTFKSSDYSGPGTIQFSASDSILSGLGYANTGYGPWPLLGFPPNFTLATPGTSITASFMPSMMGITQVNIQSRALAPANSFREAGLVSDWFQIVPVTAPFQGLNVDECKVDGLCQVTYDRPRTINVIDIQLVDHDGNEVNLNGSPFNMDVRVFYNTLV